MATFRGRAEVIEDALSRQGLKVGYVGEKLPAGFDEWEGPV